MKDRWLALVLHVLCLSLPRTVASLARTVPSLARTAPRRLLPLPRSNPRYKQNPNRTPVQKNQGGQGGAKVTQHTEATPEVLVMEHPANKHTKKIRVHTRRTDTRCLSFKCCYLLITSWKYYMFNNSCLSFKCWHLLITSWKYLIKQYKLKPLLSLPPIILKLRELYEAITIELIKHLEVKSTVRLPSPKDLTFSSRNVITLVFTSFFS